MIDELQSRQILSLAAQGAPAAEIATSLNIEEALVKLVLARHNPSAERDIDDDQLAALRRHAYNLAIGSTDEAVQARLTMFLIERDKPKSDQRGSSITAINNALILANDSFKKLVEDYQT